MARFWLADKPSPSIEYLAKLLAGITMGAYSRGQRDAEREQFAIIEGKTKGAISHEEFEQVVDGYLAAYGTAERDSLVDLLERSARAAWYLGGKAERNSRDQES